MIGRTMPDQAERTAHDRAHPVTDPLIIGGIVIVQILDRILDVAAHHVGKPGIPLQVDRAKGGELRCRQQAAGAIKHHADHDRAMTAETPPGAIKLIPRRDQLVVLETSLPTGTSSITEAGPGARRTMSPLRGVHGFGLMPTSSGKGWRAQAGRRRTRRGWEPQSCGLRPFDTSASSSSRQGWPDTWIPG